MRSTKTYTCRACGASRFDWEIFETGWPSKVKYYCLGHVPRLVRLRMWLKGVR